MSDLTRIKATNLNDLVDIEVDGIDHADFPDYSDAYINSASYPDGTELTDEELEVVNDDSMFVYGKVEDWLY